MDYELSYSIRKHLQSNVRELSSVLIMHDGIKLTGTPKPFCTLQDFDLGRERAAAGGSFEESYSYQIGVFANNVGELKKLSEVIKEVLLEEIPLYDKDLNLTDKTFECDVLGFTPMTNDDTSNETFNNRGYLDVEVTVFRNKGDKSFTQ